MQNKKILIFDEEPFLFQLISTICKTNVSFYLKKEYNPNENLEADVLVLTDKKFKRYFNLIRNNNNHKEIILIFEKMELEELLFYYNSGFSYILNSSENNFSKNLSKLLNEVLAKGSQDEGCDFVYKSLSIRKIIKKIRTIGENENFILEGETGVGKTPISYFANYVKNIRTPFVRVNCAGLSREYFYSLIFGHTKGAYTGAYNDKAGLVEFAKDGDLFLDEIASLDLDAQGLLLNFLDTGEYRKMGETKLKFSKVRIICATNQDLFAMCKNGKFRKDLLARFYNYFIVPPLRERREDIMPIFEYYSNKFLGYNKKLDAISKNYINTYDWSNGNVRELKAYVKNFSLFGPTYKVYKQEKTTLFPVDVYEQKISEQGLKNFMKNIEFGVLENLYSKHNSVDKLAKFCRISAPAMCKKLKKYRLT